MLTMKINRIRFLLIGALPLFALNNGLFFLTDHDKLFFYVGFSDLSKALFLLHHRITVQCRYPELLMKISSFFPGCPVIIRRL
jgi:hypothetical protein